ncbi:MAG: DUF2975 domain-containing protein [Cytophagia bacterium]|nr:MAG: DUF2975 domain-containing protein [Cytophagales bacterium]TAG37332.1 MAG: DUF2975 domain-containing protein [Cytophagia bacterium]TAG74231.1 MAG: DUF2975 domain-containing protein [Runella slithyformis]TAG78314.1 MAG: DUF2975 domain-containing protein [Cytophagales bacterium]
MKKSKRYLLLLANLILAGLVVHLIMMIFSKTESLAPFKVLSSCCTLIAVVLFRKMLKQADSVSIFSPQNIQTIRLMGFLYLGLGVASAFLQITDLVNSSSYKFELSPEDIIFFIGSVIGTFFGVLVCLLQTPVLFAGFFLLGIGEIMKTGFELKQEQDLTI